MMALGIEAENFVQKKKLYPKPLAPVASRNARPIGFAHRHRARIAVVGTGEAFPSLAGIGRIDYFL